MPKGVNIEYRCSAHKIFYLKLLKAYQQLRRPYSSQDEIPKIEFPRYWDRLPGMEA
jgi:hypothetical protein